MLQEVKRTEENEPDIGGREGSGGTGGKKKARLVGLLGL